MHACMMLFDEPSMRANVRVYVTVYICKSLYCTSRQSPISHTDLPFHPRSAHRIPLSWASPPPHPTPRRIRREPPEGNWPAGSFVSWSESLTEQWRRARCFGSQRYRGERRAASTLYNSSVEIQYSLPALSIYPVGTPAL
jgi:hypothetical protein